MPGLDVLRGLAILAVLLFHGFSSERIAFTALNNPFLATFWRLTTLGVLGVHLFFVLSGFLITGILLDSRTKEDYYRGFFLRRVLRIAPAYLLMLIVLKLTHVIDWPYLLVCLAYLANVCSVFHVRPLYGPLWSLSVEEQFYITWPFLVKKLSNRGLLRLSIAIIVLTPLLRIGLSFGPHLISDWPHKTWGVADFFAAGAILALATRTAWLAEWMRKAAVPLIVLGAILAFVDVWIPASTGPVVFIVRRCLALEPYLLLWTGAVWMAYLKPGIAGFRVLRPLIFLADISYGLYLYHQFIFTKIEDHWVMPQGTPGANVTFLVLRFLVELSLSIAVAWVSRRTLEAFFLRMKPKRKDAAELAPASSL